MRTDTQSEARHWAKGWRQQALTQERPFARIRARHFTLMGVSKMQKLVRARVRILGILSTPCAFFAVTAHLGVGGVTGIKEINNNKKHFVVAPSLLWPTLLWMHVETTPKLMSESKRWGGPGWPIAVIVSLLLLALRRRRRRKKSRKGPQRPVLPVARRVVQQTARDSMGVSRGRLALRGFATSLSSTANNH